MAMPSSCRPGSSAAPTGGTRARISRPAPLSSPPAGLSGRRMSASPPPSGAPELLVFRRLRVAIFSTGDEVYEPGAALGEGGIYDSNRYVIAGLAERLGCALNRHGHPAGQARRDHRRAGRAQPATTTCCSPPAACRPATRITSRRRWRPSATCISGASPIRPGRPIALGQVGRVPFIGLPGNPVAVMVTFLRFARPLILRLGGCNRSGACALPGAGGVRLQEEARAARMAAGAALGAAGWQPSGRRNSPATAPESSHRRSSPTA